MHSVLFSIGNFKIFTYGLVLVIAIIAGVSLAGYLGKRHRFDALDISEVGVWMVVFGLIGARLAFVAQNFDHYCQEPWQILNLRTGGISIQGAMVFGFAAVAWNFRKLGVSSLTGLDIYAAPALLGMAIGRIGCVLQGCCAGKVCTVPWGIVYPPAAQLGSLPRHPSQIYELLLDLLLMTLLIVLYNKAKFRGQAFWASVGGYGIIRFITEFFREGAVLDGLTLAQWFSIGFFVVGLLGVCGVYGRKPVEYGSATANSSPEDLPATSVS